MMAESGHLDLHERIEGQRTQNFMEFGGALHIEEADVRVLAGDAPEMEPLALQLQFLCPLVLLRAELFDLSASASCGMWTAMLTWNNMLYSPLLAGLCLLAEFADDRDLGTGHLCSSASAYSERTADSGR